MKNLPKAWCKGVIQGLDWPQAGQWLGSDWGRHLNGEFDIIHISMYIYMDMDIYMYG